MILLSLLACLAAAFSAVGATFTVNSTADAADFAPGDGLCLSVSKQCTLRAAVMEANATKLADVIVLPAGVYRLEEGQLDIIGSMTVRGAGNTKTVIDGQGKSRVLNVAGGVVLIQGLTIRNGFLQNDQGGCVLNAGQLTMTSAIITGCTNELTDYELEAFGGGIANLGQLSLQGCQIVNNALTGLDGLAYGAGLYNQRGARLKMTRTTVSGNRSGGPWIQGGGLYNRGYIELTESTFARNYTLDGGAGAIGNEGTAKLLKSTFNANGGGWIGTGGISNGGTMTIANCTISSNRALDSCGGVTSSGDLLIQNSTIYANHSDNVNGGGGGGICAYGATTAKNSIVAGNSIRSNEEGGVDCYGPGLGSLNYSLIGSTSGCTIPKAGVGNLLNLNPKLGRLSNNGGKTQTHALLTGSVAIYAGNPARPGTGGNSCEKTDQRGIVRPQNGRCDMGAYERRPRVPYAAGENDEE